MPSFHLWYYVVIIQNYKCKSTIFRLYIAAGVVMIVYGLLFVVFKIWPPFDKQGDQTKVQWKYCSKIIYLHFNTYIITKKCSLFISGTSKHWKSKGDRLWQWKMKGRMKIEAKRFKSIHDGYFRRSLSTNPAWLIQPNYHDLFSLRYMSNPFLMIMTWVTTYFNNFICCEH